VPSTFLRWLLGLVYKPIIKHALSHTTMGR
jgi:hypothetical protein